MALVVALCMGLAGCATSSGRFGSAARGAPFGDPALTVQQASHALAVGSSTRADVLDRLGVAKVVRFDSGVEVWAYGGPPVGSQAGGPGELVLLFTPSGVLQKMRVRLPDKPPA